jgi:RNA polymerase sigma factor (TIGR02999 family)
MAKLTQLMLAAKDGDARSAELLFRAVYDDLHRLAARQVARGGGGGHGRTSLVHEVYMRLAKPEALDLNDSQHFFAVAARAMRQVAVDHARERLAVKRGGGAPATTLGAVEVWATEDGNRHEQMFALNAAMEALEAVDPRTARLVELRFFGGLKLEEAGELLGMSARTLKRDFRRARAFLHAQLGDGSALDVADD